MANTSKDPWKEHYEKQLRKENRGPDGLNVTERRLLRALNKIKIYPISQCPVSLQKVDFGCVDAQVAIEVRGKIHNQPDVKERDEHREFYLNRIGWEVWPVTAEDLYPSPDWVARGIKEGLFKKLKERSATDTELDAFSYVDEFKKEDLKDELQRTDRDYAVLTIREDEMEETSESEDDGGERVNPNPDNTVKSPSFLEKAHLYRLAQIFYPLKGLEKMKNALKKIGIELVKWGITAIIAILISNFVITQLSITNSFLMLLLTAAVISILIQAVRIHEHDIQFNANWFSFFFLCYATTIFAMQSILSKITTPTSILSSVIIGVVIAALLVLIQKMHLKSRTIPWISAILVGVLIVANLATLQAGINYVQEGAANTSTMPENKQSCPTMSGSGFTALKSDFPAGLVGSKLKATIDRTWKTEHDFSPCYLGKYQGQYPDSYYCDDMIVSRWETGSSGTISYRWYTAVSGEFKPQGAGSSTYVFAGFTCENGQKVTVSKGVTKYYVYTSKAGTEISIPYGG